MPIDRIDNYEIVEELGTGGFGTVYRVRELGTGRELALKLLRPELASTPQSLQRFDREIRAIETLRHPGCPEIHGSGRDESGNPYFIMELLEGEELQERIERAGRLGESDALAVIEAVVDVLSAAHARGIIHRDIKASNVFLCKDGRIVLLDFGVAKVIDVPGRSLTLSRQIIGTPVAMAPEQIVGDRVDERTDVYALGALTYHMLTGELPFEASTATLMRMMHIHSARRSPSERAPIAPAVDAVVVRAMAVEPDARQPSAARFARELRAAVVGIQSAEEHSEEVVAVFVRLGVSEPGDGALCLGEAARALQAIGFAAVAEQSRGAVFVRRADVVAIDQVRGKLAEVSEALRARFGDILRIGLRVGPATFAEHRAIGGDVLIPANVLEVLS